MRLAILTALIAAAGSALAGPSGDENRRPVIEHAQLRTAAPSIAANPAASASRVRERAELLMQGEEALARADTEGARQAFERAGSIQHAADSEMGLVRAYMQGGEYRQALAFAAHTAGAHRDVPGGVALYAWLLNLGGQGAHAKRLIDEAHERFESDPIVGRVRGQLKSGRPVASGALLDAPARLAPYSATTVPQAARVAGSGWLFDAGKRALVPTSTLGGASAVWVRNGLAQTVRATVEKHHAALQVSVLKLEKALPLDSQDAIASRDPFPGSVAFAVEYVDSRDATPRWPILRSGFMGQPSEDGTRRKLGLDMPPGPRGGPVFDAAGHVAGIALRGNHQSDMLLPPSGLKVVVGNDSASPSGPASAPQVSADVIYESALRSTVQIIVPR
jgi:hypothetical protein